MLRPPVILQHPEVKPKEIIVISWAQKISGFSCALPSSRLWMFLSRTDISVKCHAI
ncbi:MAG TPA: hypothetical protein VJI32_01435 [Candidatus Nanoarchaeia archaeon]|nr:hypothetical protein [Candidatus Woesearchaeota archaeon]HLC70638.1 hypothetical protein [Candidatus Nanoarchaeia archaeon]